MESEAFAVPKSVDEPTPFNKPGYSSFGKASICSSFSVKSGGSSSTTGKETIDNLLKTIAKDQHTSKQESVNDVKINRYDSGIENSEEQLSGTSYSSRVTINKTSELENNTDTLKKLSATDKPNNQTKLASFGGTPLPPSQIKCNILKGKRQSILIVEFLFG